MSLVASSTSIPNEAERRKPEWCEATGEWIALKEGLWLFPKPIVEYFPKFVDGRAVFATGSSYGDAFDELVETVLQSETISDYYGSMFGLAVDMIQRNYHLNDEEMSALFRTEKGNEADDERWRQVLAVAKGSAPKPSPAGGDAA